MGKSYVLKEKNERICGFVMQMGSNLSYRITHFVKKPLMLTAVYSEGESICTEVADSDEHRQKAGSGELLRTAYGYWRRCSKRILSQKKQSYSQSAIQLMQLCEHRNRSKSFRKRRSHRFYQERKAMASAAMYILRTFFERQMD